VTQLCSGRFAHLLLALADLLSIQSYYLTLYRFVSLAWIRMPQHTSDCFVGTEHRRTPRPLLLSLPSLLLLLLLSMPALMMSVMMPLMKAIVVASKSPVAVVGPLAWQRWPEIGP
jgi:hypothetical protein